jgi:hypothetical protein
MEEKQGVTFSKMLPSAAKNGLYVALLGILFSLLIYAFNLSFFAIFFVGLLAFISNIVLVILLSVNYRKKELDNQMKYFDALIYTFVVGLVGYLMISIFGAIYQYVIDPSYVDGLAQRLEIMLESKGVAQADINKALDGIMKQKEFGGFVVSQLKGILIFNLVVILIAPLFVKKSAPVF